MPASLLSDMESNSKDLHHTRAYELALELSMMGFANENESPSTSFDSEIRNKRSQNTTECVPVPSSEHVAEIVGRQGCKIKALRTKTNTYIKTPVRGEEPVFVVTGRREDVNAAKREILSAAEHFSQIRAQRKNNLNSSLVPGPNSIIPGQKTIQVRVPYHVVGLVVGPKGATIKRIQQLTNTYIVTPSRDKQPVFEVTGFPDNVESARKEIEAHIAVRTGSLAESDDDFDFSVYTNNLNAVNCGLFKTDFDGELIHPFSFESNNTLDLSNDTFNLPLSNVNSKDSDLYSAMYTNSITNVLSLYDAEETLNNSPVFDASGLLVSSSWPDFRSCPLTNSLSLLGSSSVRTTTECSSPRSNAFNDFVLIDQSTCATTDTSTAPFDQNCLSKNNSGNTSISSFPLFLNGMCNSSITDLSSNTTTSSVSDICRNSRPTEASAFCRKPNRDCLVCHERKVDAALVPCGHNLFCLMCANHLCEKSECPVCHQSATQAIRIYS